MKKLQKIIKEKKKELDIEEEKLKEEVKDFFKGFKEMKEAEEVEDINFKKKLDLDKDNAKKDNEIQELNKKMKE